MRRQIGHTCLVSSGPQVLLTAGLKAHLVNVLGQVASFHHHHPVNNRGKTVEASATTTGAAVALTPAASTAYKQTVQFARDRLFTTNHRTTEYFTSNEKQILQALRGVIKEVFSGLSPLDASAAPFWLATTVEVPEGSNAPTTLEELSTQFYKELGLTSVFNTNAVVAAASSATASPSTDLTGQIRNLLALRSHHGLVLTDQMLVLALLALSAPMMTQYPEATVTSPADTKGSASEATYLHQRVLTVAELGGTLPASATSPTVPTSGTIEGTFPSACLDVLRVIAEDQRLPLHPLVLSAVTSIIRGIEASTAGRFLRYRGGDELPEAGPSSRLALVASSSASNSSQHLSHPMQYIVACHLKSLLRHLVALHVLVDPNSESSATSAKMYYGDGSSNSLAAQWFGGDASAGTVVGAEIDLLSLFLSVVDESVSADSQPFRRRGGDSNGSRQLSALERSMLGGGETLVSSSAAADKKGPSSTGKEGSHHALKISTKVNIKVLHLRLLSALAELAATLACRDVLEIVMHTLMSVHADVFHACLQTSSAHHEQEVIGCCLAEALPIIDSTLQLLGYGFFMSDYAGAGRGEARSSPSMPLFMSLKNHPLADSLWALVTAQPAAAEEGQSASRFLSVFPNLAEASSSASTRSESALTAAVKKELEAVMAHAAAVASTRAYCYSHLFPAHNGLVGLFPQIVDGEGDAALKALEELRTAEREQLFDGLLSYVASDLIGPCSQRVHDALAMASSASEDESADLIALDAVVSTNLRSIVEIMDAVLIADAADSSEETANPARCMAHCRSGARTDPRMVGYAVERFENLGSRLFGDEPAYASITDEMLEGRGDAAELMADAYPKTVFKASEYACWQSFASNLLTEVVSPLCESDDLHLQPRTIDLLVALQRRLLGISTAMAEAEVNAADSLQAVDSAVGDLTAAISCSAELLGFIKAISLPKLSSAVVAGVEGSSAGVSGLDESAALVGAIAQLAVSADALETTARSLRNKFGAGEVGAQESVDVPSRPLISTVVKPMMQTLFATHLAAHAEEMREAHKAAVGVISHSNNKSSPHGKEANSEEDVLRVSGRRKSAATADSSTLNLPSEGLAAVPVAEVFRPLSSFTRLFEAARAAEDTELCLMLRSLRTTLFN